MIKRKKNTKILMISSTASIGGGPNHIFLLCEIISPEFEVFYASPKINNKVLIQKLCSNY